MDVHAACGRKYHFRKIGRIIARTFAGCHAADDMGIHIDGEHQFRPSPVVFGSFASVQIMTADVMAFHARGINGNGYEVAHYADVVAFSNNGGEKPVKSPFFISRWAAF